MGKIIVSRMNETKYYSMHYNQNLCSNSFVVTMACSEYFLDQASDQITHLNLYTSVTQIQYCVCNYACTMYVYI